MTLAILLSLLALALSIFTIVVQRRTARQLREAAEQLRRMHAAPDAPKPWWGGPEGREFFKPQGPENQIVRMGLTGHDIGER